jgi:omega-6 fatty acid desaturase (delta-12 desaturase)
MVDVLNVLPDDALSINLPYAMFTAVRVWITVILSYYLLVNSPWYLLPLAWIFTGTAITGLFVVGHECAHQAFSRSKLLNEIVGTICMMPLVFPYNAWDMTHSHHHAHANNLGKDHLWKPLMREEVSKMGKIKKLISYYMYGPLFFESSIFHHAYHFLLPFVSSRNRLENIRSIIFALLGGYITIRYLLEFGSFYKLFLVPFLVFQFWLSTFTYFHHRQIASDDKPPVGWKKDSEWDKVYGGLYATVHVDYPAWVEFLTLDINWHLPHHVSARIPWYNLRKCTYSLLQTFGSDLHTGEFNWEMWRKTTTSTHLYDEVHGFAPMEW